MNTNIKPVPPHVERMVLECFALGEKILTLGRFILIDATFHTLPDAEKDDMREQLQYMKNYQAVLERRIDRAGVSL